MSKKTNYRGVTPAKGKRPAKAGRGAHTAESAKKTLKAKTGLSGKKIVFTLFKGPFQNNGATQWFAHVPMGSDGQLMKIALDTGSNFIWVTSTLCGPTGCKHYGGGQFNPAQSSSFSWIDQKPKPVSFGPWGTMTVEEGADNYIVNPDPMVPLEINVRSNFYLATNYNSTQFAELDWDGGIGFPSGSDYADPDIPPFYAALLNMGLIDPANPYISFCTDEKSGKGKVILGGYDTREFDAESGIFMPWTPYTAFSGVEYIWTSALAQMWVGNDLIASNKLFALDSGSSQFKGDNGIMNETLKRVKGMNPPKVKLVVGHTSSGEQGKIIIPPSVYNVKIEAGQGSGEVIPQFKPLGLTDLVLVGSVLMDHLYTIFQYDITENADGTYQLNPYGMWLFNKKNGPKLIQSKSTPGFLKQQK